MLTKTVKTNKTGETDRVLAGIQARYDMAVNTPWFDGRYTVNDSKGNPVCCFTRDSDKRFVAQATRDIPWLLNLVKELYTQLDSQAEQIAFIDTLLDDNIRRGDDIEKLEEENNQLKLDVEKYRKMLYNQQNNIY